MDVKRVKCGEILRRLSSDVIVRVRFSSRLGLGRCIVSARFSVRDASTSEFYSLHVCCPVRTHTTISYNYVAVKLA